LQFPEWTWVIGLFIGAAIGSFLNVCIYRLPRGLSISNPPNSFCPSCKHRLGVLDLFPLLSWLFLGGKCRHCKEKIHPRYFIVELINGGFWAVLWWQYFVAGWDPAAFFAYAFFGSALLVAIATDLEHYIIPDEINFFLLVVGFGYHGFKGDIMTAVWGALVGWGLLWGIAFLGRLAFGKDAMGHGDIKMMRGIGALLGPLQVVITLFIAVILGVVGGIVQIAMKKAPAAAGEGQEPEYDPPERIGDLTKAGLGYLLCVDGVALFAPKVGTAWFGEDQMAQEELDDWTPQPTAIPFGPYLAIGAVITAIFAAPLTKLVNDYFNPAGGQPGMLEHLILGGGHRIV
jgi:leader peptidase (prepilin peptidase) / N-methyltransferase